MILTHLIAFDFWPGATDAAIVEPDAVTSGGAVIVDIPKKRKRREKEEEKAKDAVSPEAREITEDEAAGMAAIYGVPFREAVPETIPEETQDNPPISLDFVEIIPKNAVISPIIDGKTPESISSEQPENVIEEDDIGLILAIIEAIG